MTGMNRPRTALIAAALVCVLASGGCASGHAAQENGTTGGQTAPTSAKSSQEVNAETTSSGIQEETSPSDKEISAEPVNHVNGSSENGAAEAESRTSLDPLKLQETVLKGMVWTASEKRMVYNTADNSFAWWCLYGIAGTGAAQGETEVSVKTGKLKEYMSVLFEGKTELPAIPESMAGFIVPDEKDDAVIFHIEGAIDGSFTFSEPEPVDEDHVKITGTWNTEETDPPAIQFYLVNRAGDDYPYTVQYMEMEGYVCNDILEGDRVFEP